MKSLLIGNGAREHAVAEKMAENSELYVFMSSHNPGIARLAKETKIGKLNDFSPILKFALHCKPDYIFIGPEAPLADGIGDDLNRNGFKIVGPTKIAARLESDKAFCRNLMQEYVKTGYPKFAVCTSAEEINNALDEFSTDLVVKPLGLTGGKGVKVQGQQLADLFEVREYAEQIIQDGIGGSSTVVLEEKLEGEEFTLQVFTDGRTIVPVPIVQDHKHAFINDEGPMTGGMGSYSDASHTLPFIEDKDVEDALDIMKRTIDALKEKTDMTYKGVLYGQFMLTKEGPKVIEYNVRFGDPEAMNVLPILKTDFSEICMSILDNALSPGMEFEPLATVCKYLVPKGYPTKPEAGALITIDESQVTSTGARLYYASVDQRQDGLYTSKSRSLGIVGFGQTIEEAEGIAQAAIQTVKCDDLFHRPDIGTKELVERRIAHMKEVRG